MSKIRISLLIIIITSILYFPIFKGKTPLSGNLLVSFYNPWAQETMPNWEQGVPKKPTGIDDIRIFYPQRTITDKILKQGQIPVWDPYSYSGTLHLARSETAIFYPLNLLFLILPQNFVWTVLVFIQPIIAGIGMLLYLTSIIKDRRACMFGSITFGFSSIVIVRSIEGLSVGHSLIWFPYVLWGIERYLQTRKVKLPAPTGGASLTSGFLGERNPVPKAISYHPSTSLHRWPSVTGLRFLVIQTSALVFSILAGWFQYTFYIFAVSLAYFLFRIITLRKVSDKMIYLPGTAFILAPLLTLPHLLPSIKAYFLSPRGIQSVDTAISHLMPLSHLFTFLTPDLFGNPGTYNYFGKSEYKEAVMYIGIVPFILSLYSRFSLRKHLLETFYLTLTAVSLLIGIDNPISRFILSLPIPILSSFLPNRIFLVVVFSMSVLVAFGVKNLLNREWGNENSMLLRFIFGILSILAIIDLYLIVRISEVKLLITDNLYTYISRIIISLRTTFYFIGDTPLNRIYITQIRNLALSHVIVFLLLLLIFFRRKIEQKAFITICLLLTVAGQFYFTRKYIYFSEKKFIFPQHTVFSYLSDHAGISRFVSLGDGHIKPNFPNQYGLYSPDGIGSMYLQRYGELITYVQSSDHVLRPVPRIEIAITPHPSTIFDERDKYYLRLFQILGVKYLIKIDKESIEALNMQAENPVGFTKVMNTGKWQIYKYLDTNPRYYLTASYEVASNDKAVMDLLFALNKDSKKLILEQKPSLTPEVDNTAQVELLAYTPNQVIFKTNTQKPQLLYLSDAYHPEFKALIDGEQAEILRANYAFRAISVPAGKHTVKMYYDTSSIFKYFAISGSILAIIALVITLRIKTKSVQW